MNDNLRIISYNVNGIRAAIKKGFIDWLNTDPADIICLQEIKANESDIDLVPIESAGYRDYFFSAQKKGYSGVGILSKLEPDNVEYGHGKEQSDFEGRVLRADFSDITLISVIFHPAQWVKQDRLINTFGSMNFWIISMN
jgi:exodeoxyribonuclease-3